MFTSIDNFLNKITMYRLVLYYVIGLLIAAFILSVFGLMPFGPISLLYSTILITLLCWLANTISSWIFKVPTNVESVYITALILALIISPIKTPDVAYFGFIIWAAVLSQASKYILAIYRKHIFNPVAFSVAVTALVINQSASWWVGTAALLPFVVIGGFLLIRKMRRWDLMLSFFIVALGTFIALDFLAGFPVGPATQKFLLSSPLFFFAFVMLSEPLTTPPTRGLQIAYGALVGALFVPQAHVGSFFFTPELALLAGNIFSYAVSPKKKLLLTFKEKVLIGPNMYNFIFTPDTKLSFRAGQYLEWTVGHDHPDNRGNRRYFTIASSPTESEIIMGVKFYEPASSYKQTMLAMQPGEQILSGQLAGDFTLPKDKKEKSVFIAGGIGITPFRSMVKYLIDSDDPRDITLLYSNKNVSEIAYADIFDTAVKVFGMKAIYTITDTASVPADWKGQVGPITAEMIAAKIPDFKQRVFYISGPHGMVTAFETILVKMGVHKNKIKTDFFPGFV